MTSTISQELNTQQTNRQWIAAYFNMPQLMRTTRQVADTLVNLVRRILYQSPIKTSLFEDDLSYKVDAVIRCFPKDLEKPPYYENKTMFLPTVTDAFRVLGQECFRHQHLIIITNLRSGKSIVLNQN